MLIFTVFIVAAVLGYMVGWESALDAMQPRVLKAIQLMAEAGYFNEDLIEPEKLEEIFNKAIA